MLKKNGSVFFIYLVMLTVTLLLFGWNVSRTPKQKNQTNNFSAVSFAYGWTDESGETVSPEEINLSQNHPAGKQFSIYNRLPHEMWMDQTLTFRSAGLIFSVSVDDTVLYTFGTESTHIFGNSPGSSLHEISVPAKYAGKTICITYSTSYNSRYERLSDLYIGNGVQILRKQISDNLFSIIICMVLISIGILYILIDFPVSKIVNPNHSLLYLGIFSVVVGTWSATETHVPSLFIHSTQALCCFSLMLLSLVAIPLGLFLSASFPVQYPRMLRIGYILSAAGFFLSMILYLTGTADYSQTLIISQLVICYFLIATVRNLAANLYRKQCAGPEKWLIMISVSVMAAGVLIDLILSKFIYQTDNSRFTRVGMAVIIICFGMVTCLQTMKRFKTASQLEVISQLAYKDGLTGIGNRTAFNERVEAFSARQEESLKLTVLMFDVNNLKLANDRYGHQQGDILIRGASKTIQTAFSKIGDVYRIGGDEFVVLAVGISQPQPIELALKELELQISLFNQTGACPVPLSIACGYACSQTVPDTVDSLIQTADERMYENKRLMKSKTAAV